MLAACEDIYTAKIDNMENALVIDAQIVSNSDSNYIQLSQTVNFNSSSFLGNQVRNASVYLIDNNNIEYNLPEESIGTFKVNVNINPSLIYKIRVEYEGETYESTYESVPEVPKMDSIYGIPEIKVTDFGGVNSVNDFREYPGVQLYANLNNEDSLHYYRFDSRKILQYIYYIESTGMTPPIPIYGWYTKKLLGGFNLAAPADYSTSDRIEKHPLFFMEKSLILDQGQSFAGWILILYQYSLTSSAYHFYKDLNNQLVGEGRIFDPLYVQARNNLKCTSNPDKLVMGNFEITSMKETRYFVKFISKEKGYLIKPITHFYEIPSRGEQTGELPDFWENVYN